MAEGEGWWGSLSGVVNAAKNMSVEVLEFVKRDLDELSTTVGTETSNFLNSTTTALKEQLSLDEPESTVNSVKRSASSFWGTMNTVLNPSPDDSEQETMVIKDNVPVVLSRFQAQLHTLMTTESTFTEQPKGVEAAQFKAWVEIQDDPLNTDKLSKLMVANAELHIQYTKLVPAKVSHSDFWERFLFRRALLEDDEARHQAQDRRQLREAREAENYLRNQEENFGNDGADISEEEQTRLLQDYEKECEARQSDNKDDPSSSSSSSPRKLRIKENHYSEGKSPDSESTPTGSESSIISDAKSKLFTFMKTAIDSLEFLEVDTETEESTNNSVRDEKEKGIKESVSGDCNENTTSVKDKSDLVILENSEDKGEDTDTSAYVMTDQVTSSSSSSSTTLPDDEWERVGD